MLREARGADAFHMSPGPGLDTRSPGIQSGCGSFIYPSPWQSVGVSPDGLYTSRLRDVVTGNICVGAQPLTRHDGPVALFFVIRIRDLKIANSCFLKLGITGSGPGWIEERIAKGRALPRQSSSIPSTFAVELLTREIPDVKHSSLVTLAVGWNSTMYVYVDDNLAVVKPFSGMLQRISPPLFPIVELAGDVAEFEYLPHKVLSLRVGLTMERLFREMPSNRGTLSYGSSGSGSAEYRSGCRSFLYPSPWPSVDVSEDGVCITRARHRGPGSIAIGALPLIRHGQFTAFFSVTVQKVAGSASIGLMIGITETTPEELKSKLGQNARDQKYPVPRSAVTLPGTHVVGLQGATRNSEGDGIKAGSLVTVVLGLDYYMYTFVDAAPVERAAPASLVERGSFRLHPIVELSGQAQQVAISDAPLLPSIVHVMEEYWRCSDSDGDHRDGALGSSSSVRRPDLLGFLAQFWSIAQTPGTPTGDTTTSRGGEGALPEGVQHSCSFDEQAIDQFAALASGIEQQVESVLVHLGTHYRQSGPEQLHTLSTMLRNAAERIAGFFNLETSMASNSNVNEEEHGEEESGSEGFEFDEEDSAVKEPSGTESKDPDM